MFPHIIEGFELGLGCLRNLSDESGCTIGVPGRFRNLSDEFGCIVGVLGENVV